MTTASEEKAGQEEYPLVPGPLPLRREERTCATSVPLPSAASLQPATQRARAVGRYAAQVAEFLDRPGSLVHAQPPSLARAREQHHEAAGRHGFRFVRHLRLAYGYLHLIVIKPVLNGLEWVTETPLRLFIAVIIGVIIYFGS